MFLEISMNSFVYFAELDYSRFLNIENYTDTFYPSLIIKKYRN